MVPFYSAAVGNFYSALDMGNSPEIVRKHYGKWSVARQNRIDELIERVYVGTDYVIPEKARIQ